MLFLLPPMLSSVARSARLAGRRRPELGLAASSRCLHHQDPVRHETPAAEALQERRAVAACSEGQQRAAAAAWRAT